VIPVEFCIDGPPVSQQANSTARLREWKQRVRSAAERAISRLGPPYTGPVRLTIQHFYDGEKPILDGDNMLKPIQDALQGLVYVNDRQVRSSECDQLKIDRPFSMPGVSAVLALSLIEGREFVHIKVDFPREELRR
jgi:crossover junction endodeoxyribonuclease RusA